MKKRFSIQKSQSTKLASMPCSIYTIFDFNPEFSRKMTQTLHFQKIYFFATQTTPVRKIQSKVKTVSAMRFKLRIIKNKLDIF